MNLFTTASAFEKLRNLDSALNGLLNLEPRYLVETPLQPARDVAIVRLHELPPKPGLSTLQGQARLLHDLASIELQAMELGLRTLTEYPDAPKEFREQLAEITRSEGEHLKLCFEAIEACGAKWGDWPVHVSLWEAATHGEELIHRILVVHRHLEGSGLDAGDSILRRLSGVASKLTRTSVKRIVDEEVGHVDFGSQWYREICKLEKRDADREFKERMPQIMMQTPRNEKLDRIRRQAAGFSIDEIDFLEVLQIKNRERCHVKKV
jgi:uncharacterized ferritin-like protein (DUF455 family)